MADPKQQLLPPITVKVGEPFFVHLPDQSGSTGYTVCLTELPPNLALVSDAYEPPKNNIPGAPGERTFTFVAIKSGEGPLYFNGIRFSNPIEVAPRGVLQSRFVIAKDL